VAEDNILDKQIVIKKYSNRRLYDTAHKKYVTLDDISTLIQDGYEIKVIDSQTDEDITKIILLQVIWEGEKNKQDILPTSFLHMLIKYGNQIAKEFFENYFLMMFQPYLSFQEKMSKNFQSLQDFGWLSPTFKMPDPSDILRTPSPKGTNSPTNEEVRAEHTPQPGSPSGEPSLEEIVALMDKLKELENKIESMDKPTKAPGEKTGEKTKESSD